MVIAEWLMILLLAVILGGFCAWAIYIAPVSAW
jgi:hypothetical protein